MKTTFKLFGIIALMAVIGFVLIACGDGADGGGGPGTTVLEGTWTADGGRVAIFTGNSFVYKVNGDTRYSGTFSLSGSTITFTIPTGSASGDFSVLGPILILTNHTWDATVEGTYTKGGGGGTPWTWGVYSDSSDGGSSTITMSESSGTHSFTGELKNGYAYPYAGINAFPNAEMLAFLKTAVSIKFDFYGDGKQYRLIVPTSDIGNYQYYSFYFTPTANQWTTYTVNVSQLAQPDWGDGGVTKSFTQSLAEWIQWETTGTIATFSVQIKNLQLIQSGNNVSVSFNGLGANGSSTETTTQLALIFSQAIAGLTASDITLSGVSGISKGTLSGSGPTYTLPISGFTGGGNLSVSVSKSGYAISGSPKNTTIYFYSGGGPTAIDGTWTASNPTRSITLSGNNWTYAENGSPYCRGVWAANFTVANGSSGRLTLTVNEVRSGNSWAALPSQYQSVKTNTVDVSINAEGTTMVLSNPELTTSGIWGTTAGTYTKSGGGSAGNGTLTITGVPANLVNSVTSWGGSVGTFPTGTTIQQALTPNATQHAGAAFENAIVTQTGNTYTVTVTLTTPPYFTTPWTASGSYQVFVLIGNSNNTGVAYGMQASFSSGSATLNFTSFTNLGSLSL